MTSRWSPSGAAEIRLLAQGENAFIGMLTMEAGAKVPKHQDTTEEYIVVLEGGGTISIDGVKTVIAAGDTVYMPANATVQYENGTSTMRAVQVFAGPSPARKYDAWRTANPSLSTPR